jgi:predicted esterase
MKVDHINLPEVKIYHVGPSLNDGPRPSLFYFSLSGEESLALGPYNQPAVLLSEQGIRVFSLTLPGHEGAFPHSQAVKSWGENLLAGTDIIDEFTGQCMQALDFLVQDQIVDPARVCAAGLSRGAFMAAHLAAKDQRIHTVLGFAPLTTLSTITDLKKIADPRALSSYSLEALIPKLVNKTLRFYIGNHDTLVSTSLCFSFIQALTEYAYQQKHRFPPIELMIYPSIGHKGHGTPPEIFQDGASWLAKRIS